MPLLRTEMLEELVCRKRGLGKAASRAAGGNWAGRWGRAAACVSAGFCSSRESERYDNHEPNVAFSLGHRLFTWPGE